MFYTIALADFNERFASKIDLSIGAQNSIKDAQTLQAEITEFVPAEVFVRIEKDDEGGYFFDNAYVYITDTLIPSRPEFKVFVQKQWVSGTKTKYNFFSEAFRQLQYVSNQDIYEAGPTKNIFKLSASKVASALEGIKNMYLKLEALGAERAAKVDAFKQGLRDSGLDIKYSPGQDNSGYTQRGGLEFRYFISQTGHISTNIILSASSDLDTFLKISDNKLNK